jgi:crotonobetainyl-CoA:carnitine CoA-transferase CaiB-like acyl-CoA transferase
MSELRSPAPDAAPIVAPGQDPGLLDRLGLSARTIAKKNPTLTHVRVTLFTARQDLQRARHRDHYRAFDWHG